LSKKQIYRNIAYCALAAALAIGAWLLVPLFYGGVTAQDFESFRAPAEYAAALLANEAPLRAILTLDDLFLIFYTATFAFIATASWGKRKKLLVWVGLAAILVTAYLDMQENSELLTFLAMAKSGAGISAEMLHSRAVLSQVKFLSSYLSFFLFAFVLPSDTFLEKLLRWSLWVVAPVVGVLVYTYPSNLWMLARYVFMLVGLLILAWNYGLRAEHHGQSGE
jgi:hypothetical protein